MQCGQSSNPSAALPAKGLLYSDLSKRWAPIIGRELYWGAPVLKDGPCIREIHVVPGPVSMRHRGIGTIKMGNPGQIEQFQFAPKASDSLDR